MPTSSDPMEGLPTASAAVPKPSPKADIDPVLRKQLTSLQTQADAESSARLQGMQTKWMMPEQMKWNGSVFDYDGIAGAFDRSKSNEWYTDATKDATAPGTSGDLIITTTQIDYLACMERSFRARHTMTRARAMCHAMGRKNGHGNARGPLLQGVVEYINGMVKESKAGA